jgi:fido (protein-threonine AMPylation protein)
LRNLLGDCKFWIEKEAYSPDEIAVRFKHRIVQIHCFPNGNGRHSRMMGDLIIEKIFDKTVFSWGANLIWLKLAVRDPNTFMLLKLLIAMTFQGFLNLRENSRQSLFEGNQRWK